MTSKDFPPKTGGDNNEQVQAWQSFANVLNEIRAQKERGEELPRAGKIKEIGAKAVEAATAGSSEADASSEDDFLKYYHDLDDKDRAKVDKQARRHTMAETGVRGSKQLDDLRESNNADDRKLYQEYADRLELNQELYAEEMVAQRDLWSQAKRAAHLDATKDMKQFTADEQAKITAEFNRIRDTRERKAHDQLLADWLKAKDAREAEIDKEKLLEEWLYHKDRRENERYEEQLENGEHNPDDDQPGWEIPSTLEDELEVEELDRPNDNPSNETPPNPAEVDNPDDNSGASEQPVALVAIDIDRNAAIEEEAYAKARQRLTEELSKPEKGAGFVANVKNKVANMWKGNIFRGYYERKYQHEIADNLRADNDEMRAAINEKALTPERIAELSQRYAAFNTMIRMGMDSEDAIHTSAGERRTKVDRESEQYKKTVEAIRKLAMGENGYTAEVFQEEMARIRGLEGDMDGRLDNYMATALYVKGQLEHLNASDNVNDRFNQLMQGFTMYDAESREGVRTKEYRTKVDNLVEKFEHSKYGQLVPTEVLAGAASVAGWAAGAAARNRLVQAWSFGGGAVAAGFIAAAREGNMTATDRQTMARMLAEGDSDIKVDAKYNNRMSETMLKMAKANDLTRRMDAINNLDDSDPTKLLKMRNALADAILREEISAREGVDLISYSDHDNIEAERLAMTQTRVQMQADFIRLMQAQNPDFNYSRDYANKIRAAVEAQSDAQASNLNETYDALPAEAKRAFDKFYGDIEKKDEVYRKLRHQRMRREGVRAFSRTLIIGAATQEVAALFNDNVQGVIEGIRGENADAANRTMLESMRNVFTGNGNSAPNALLELSGSHEIGELTPEQMKELREAGFDVHEVYDTTTHTETVTVSAREAVGNNPEFHRNGWYDNRTSAPDLNELRAYNHGDSFSFEPQHMSSSSNGMSIDAGDIIERAQNGQIKLKLSPTIETQGNPFELTGHVEGGRVVFDVTPGTPQAEMIASGSYAYAEVVDATNNMVMATDVGSGVADTLTQTIERTSQELTGYDIVPPDGLAPRIYGTEIPMPISLHGLSARRRLQVRGSDEDTLQSEPTGENPSAEAGSNNEPTEPSAPAATEPESAPATTETGRADNPETADNAEVDDLTYESVGAVTGNLSALMSELTDGLGGREQFDEFMTENGMAGLYSYNGDALVLDSSVEAAILNGGNINSFNREYSSFVRDNNFQDNPFALLSFVASRAPRSSVPAGGAGGGRAAADNGPEQGAAADRPEQGGSQSPVDEFRSLGYNSATIARRNELIRNASDEDAARMLELDADERLRMYNENNSANADRLRGFLIDDRENLARLDESGEHFRLTPVAEEFLRRNRDLRAQHLMSDRNRINSYEGLQRAFNNYAEELGGVASIQLNVRLWNQAMSIDDLGRAAELFDMPEQGGKTLNLNGQRMFRRFVAQHYIADDIPREDLLNSFISAYNNGELD